MTLVVPFYNSAETLGRCREAIGALSPAPDRVLLVDDCSTDRSLEIARASGYEVIRNERNQGRGGAKLAALRHVHGDLAVLVDSDVICPSATLEPILRRFGEDPELSCLSAVPSPHSPFTDFSSRFKAVYMYQVLRASKGTTDFSHGCLQAVRLRDLEGLPGAFNRNFRPDDIHLGMTLSRAGKRLFLTDELQPVHERHYSFSELVKKDFIIPREFMRMMLHHRQTRQSLKQGRFAHASMAQVAAIGLTALAAIFLAAGRAEVRWAGAGLCLVLAFVLRYGFIRECRRQYGLRFAVQAALFSWCDHLIMAAGMVCGFFWAVSGYKRRSLREDLSLGL